MATPMRTDAELFRRSRLDSASGRPGFLEFGETIAATSIARDHAQTADTNELLAVDLGVERRLLGKK